MSTEGRTRAELLGRFARAGREMSYRTVMLNQAVADRLGLSATEMQCAGVLEIEGPMTSGRLAERTGLTTGAITGIVGRLVAAGLVRRAPDPADRRRVIVAVVPEKLVEVARLYEPMSRAVVELSAPLTDEQLHVVVDLFERSNAFTAKATVDLRREENKARAAEDEASAPLAGAKSGRLEFATGAHRVAIVGDASLAELFRARFQGKTPRVRARGGNVSIRHAYFEMRRASAEIAINARIPWHLAVHGGATKMRGELRDVALRGIEIDGGASDVVLHLAAPSGRVPVTIAGGASRIAIRRPEAAAVRLEVQGGASGLVLDAQRLGTVAGETVLESRATGKVTGSYEIVVTGGASDVVVERV